MIEWFLECRLLWYVDWELLHEGVLAYLSYIPKVVVIPYLLNEDYQRVLMYVHTK